MLCREIVKEKMIAHLKELGIKTADTLSVEEACQWYSRVKRGIASTGVHMPLATLITKSRNKRRARQTHRGKRGRA